MNFTKHFAVVVLNWNGQKLLEQFLPKLVQYSDAAQIYLADNASTDQSVAWVQHNFSTVKIIQNTRNLGFAGGYNEALKEVHEPYWVLINSDVEVTAGWLNRPQFLFDNQPEIGLIQPKIKSFKNPSLFEYAGAGGGFIDAFGYPYCQGRILQDIEVDQGQYDQERAIFWASGACLFVRKSVYQALQGFDARFFAHQEEIDLCWRAFRAGMLSWYTPESVVYHVGGATLSESNPHKTYLNFRNSLWMLTKNLPAAWLIPILFSRLCLDGLAGIQYVGQRKVWHTWAIIRAHGRFYAQLPTLLKERKGPFPNRYYDTFSIIAQYYLSGKRKFSQLKFGS